MLSSFDEGRLFGAAHGNGAPWVLALHGWARDHRDFNKVFGRDLDGVALDLPGFGATPEPPEAWGSEPYAWAVAPVLTAMPGPVVVVGHSFGGRVAVHLGATFPDRVAALVLTGAPLFRRTGAPTKPKARYRLARSLAKSGILSERRLEKARNRYGSADYRAAQGVMRSVLVKVSQEDYLPQLKAIRCPVDLVWGDDDREVPLEIAERIKAEVPTARLTVVPGAGHLTPLTIPQELRSAIERNRR
jgi:pimeloyl-ACP methyl ester carboxylesterase